MEEIGRGGGAWGGQGGGGGEYHAIASFMGAVRVPTVEKPSPWHLFTRLLTNSIFNVSRIDELESFDIHYTSVPQSPYKHPPSIKNILGARCFFSSLFHFHCTLFCGLAGACVNPGSFSLFVHSLVCQITHSFLNRFQPNTSPMYALPVMLFSA